MCSRDGLRVTCWEQGKQATYSTRMSKLGQPLSSGCLRGPTVRLPWVDTALGYVQAWCAVHGLDVLVSQQPAQLYCSAFPSAQGSGKSSTNFTMGLKCKIVVSP